MLIGNKSDLEDRVVEESAARQLAETLGIRYFETSAKTGENVAEAVEVLLEQVSIDLANSNHAICKIVGFLLWNVQDYSFYCAICKIAICYHAIIKVLASYGAVLEKAISYCAICKMAVCYHAICMILAFYRAICRTEVSYCATSKIATNYLKNYAIPTSYCIICKIVYYPTICKIATSYCAICKVPVQFGR